MWLVFLSAPADPRRAFEALRRACMAGSIPAQREFVDRYEAMVWRTIRAYLSQASRADQEEAVADTFIALLKDNAALLARYEPVADLPPEAYIRRQAIMQCMNRRRRQQAMKRRLEVLSTHDDPELDPESPSDDPDPERFLLDQEDIESLLGEIQTRLSPLLMLTFDLLFVRGLSIPEVASVMSCTDDVVSTRKRRILEVIRALLQDRTKH